MVRQVAGRFHQSGDASGGMLSNHPYRMSKNEAVKYLVNILCSGFTQNLQGSNLFQNVSNGVGAWIWCIAFLDADYFHGNDLPGRDRIGFVHAAKATFADKFS